MDHELKQRLIGAVVVTALAAIFIPMLFDDPVDNSAKTISEMPVPPVPPTKSAEVDNLPANQEQVLTHSEPDLKVSEFEDNQTNANNHAQSSNPTDKNALPEAKVSQNGSDIQENHPGTDVDLQNEPTDTALDTGDVIPPAEEGEDTVIAEKTAKKSTKTTDLNEKQAAVAKATSEKAKLKSANSEKSKNLHENSSKETSPAQGSKLTRWSLQAGSFSKKENAQAIVDKLRKQGFPATMLSKGNLYRIKIGPELDKKKAMEMKSKLAAQKIQSYLQSE